MKIGFFIIIEINVYFSQCINKMLFILIQTAIAMFDMLDFYESAICLNISSNNDIGTRGWQACARTLKKVIDNSFEK